MKPKGYYSLGVCLLLLSGVLLFVGCSVGRDFKRPSPGLFEAGRTTEADVRAYMGPPAQEGIRTIDGNVFKTLGYVYSEGNPYTEKVPARAATFFVHDGIVVGYDYVSSFSEDSTEFDHSKALEIRKGQTTVAAVIELLGPPGGVFVYPIVKTRGMRAYSYGYARTDRSGPRAVSNFKNVVVTFDENGVVADVKVQTGTR